MVTFSCCRNSTNGQELARKSLQAEATTSTARTQSLLLQACRRVDQQKEVELLPVSTSACSCKIRCSLQWLGVAAACVRKSNPKRVYVFIYRVSGIKMAQNPALDANGIPVPFFGEMMVLKRDGIEFHVDGIEQ